MLLMQCIQPSQEAKELLETMLIKINLREHIQKGDVERLISLES
jgi:hypothetical protein